MYKGSYSTHVRTVHSIKSTNFFKQALEKNKSIFSAAADSEAAVG